MHVCYSLVVCFLITQDLSFVHSETQLNLLVMTLVLHVCQACKDLIGTSEVQRLHVRVANWGESAEWPFVFLFMFSHYFCCVLMTLGHRRSSMCSLTLPCTVRLSNTPGCWILWWHTDCWFIPSKCFQISWWKVGSLPSNTDQDASLLLYYMLFFFL